MTHPVGVVLPTHQSTYLREALASLGRQTAPFDLLVVDDASEGGESRRVARELGVRCIRSPVTLGGNEARNVGIDEMENPWILNFDHDNVAEPHLVEGLYRAAVRRQGIGISYCTPRQIGMAQGPHPGVRRGTPLELADRNYIDAGSMFPREAWREVGGFDEAAGSIGDWEFWLSLVERGWGIAYVPEMLYRYRVHAESQSRILDPADADAFERHVRTKHAGFMAGRPGILERARRTTTRMRHRGERNRLERDPEGPMKLVLIGARSDGLAGVVLDAIAEGLPYQVVAFLDEDKELWGERVEGIPVYGGPRANMDRALAVGATGGLVSIADPQARERFAAMLRAAGVELVTLVHPSAVIAGSASIGPGVFVGAACVIGPHVRVGEGVLVQASTNIGHDSVIGANASFGATVTLGGRCRIEERASLGMGAVVFPDVIVGEDAVVGPGAVVRENVPPGAGAE